MPTALSLCRVLDLQQLCTLSHSVRDYTVTFGLASRRLGDGRAMRLPRELSGRAQPIARIPRARRTKGAGERPTGGRRCAACNRGFRNRYRRAIFRLSLRTGNIRCQATVNARSLAGPTRDTRVPPVFTPGDGQPGQAGAQSVGCCQLQHGVVPLSGHRRPGDTGQLRRTLSRPGLAGGFRRRLDFRRTAAASLALC